MKLLKRMIKVEEIKVSLFKEEVVNIKERLDVVNRDISNLEERKKLLFNEHRRKIAIGELLSCADISYYRNIINDINLRLAKTDSLHREICQELALSEEKLMESEIRRKSYIGLFEKKQSLAKKVIEKKEYKDIDELVVLRIGYES